MVRLRIPFSGEGCCLCGFLEHLVDHRMVYGMPDSMGSPRCDSIRLLLHIETMESCCQPVSTWAHGVDSVEDNFIGSTH